ncbi:MAG: glycerol-3-phosphate 1-O-acyltransferase PlsY [bacterium]|nr:glycerol-3-phosphate 1-O-acyltransferase PlsY [bacterium]
MAFVDLSSPWILCGLGYLCGSVPFGLILTRLFMGVDVRTLGSGNIGATNVLRTGNKSIAAGTLFLDALKGFLPVFLSQNTFHMLPLWVVPAVAFCALLGHLFPLWIGFKGGKGVATLAGVLLALSWPTALTLTAVWFLCAKLTKISSLSALIAMALLPLTLWFYEGTMELVLFGAFTSLLIMGKHHENIRRLLQGTESRIGSSQ